MPAAASRKKCAKTNGHVRRKPEERDAEQDAHGQVSCEPSPPLIQVIRAAEDGAGRHRRERAPRQLPQARDQVPENDAPPRGAQPPRRSTTTPARSTNGRAAAPAPRTGSHRARPLRGRRQDPRAQRPRRTQAPSFRSWPGRSHARPIASTPSPLRSSRCTTSHTGARLNPIPTSCRANSLLWFTEAMWTPLSGADRRLSTA